MARQRFVYPTSEIPHLWSSAAQESARNPQGNLFFEGGTIYSYRRSWVLGMFVEWQRERVCLETEELSGEPAGPGGEE